MIVVPSIGSWVWGESGNVCQVQKLQQYPKTKAVRLVVLCPQGVKIVPLESIAGIAPDTAEHPQIGDRVQVIPVNATGIVAELDHEFREARVNDIEGYIHPQTGYEVISAWFPYVCLRMIAPQASERAVAYDDSLSTCLQAGEDVKSARESVNLGVSSFLLHGCKHHPSPQTRQGHRDG